MRLEWKFGLMLAELKDCISTCGIYLVKSSFSSIAVNKRNRKDRHVQNGYFTIRPKPERDQRAALLTTSNNGQSFLIFAFWKVSGSYPKKFFRPHYDRRRKDRHCQKHGGFYTSFHLQPSFSRKAKTSKKFSTLQCLFFSKNTFEIILFRCRGRWPRLAHCSIWSHLS